MIDTVRAAIRPPMIGRVPWVGIEPNDTPVGISPATVELLDSLKAAVGETIVQPEAREQICEFVNTVVEAYQNCPARLDGSSAIDHPLSSTLFMTRELGITNPTTHQVSIAHDAIEDDALSKLQIEDLAGADVANYVVRLSKQDFATEALRIREQGHPDSLTDIRVSLYRDWVKGFVQDPVLFPVKVCDLVDNMFSLWKLKEEDARPRLHKYVGTAQDIIDELRNPASLGASEIPHAARIHLATHLENMLQISGKFLAREMTFTDWRKQASELEALAKHDGTDD